MDSRAVRIKRKSHQKTNTNLRHNRANFRIENQKRKERESQELDENSKSTLECFSSWCQVLKEWRRCSSYGNPCTVLVFLSFIWFIFCSVFFFLGLISSQFTSHKFLQTCRPVDHQTLTLSFGFWVLLRSLLRVPGGGYPAGAAVFFST